MGRGHRRQRAAAADSGQLAVRPTLRIVAIALAYVVAALFASALQEQEQLLGIYWPAAGVAVGGLLASPRRLWPAILGCLVALQVGYHLLVGTDLLAVLVLTSANTLGHLLVAGLVLRWRATDLGDVRSVMAFGAAALAGSVPAAVVGAVGSVRIAAELNVIAAGITWLVGDWLGVLTLAPLVLLVTGRLPWPRERAAELALVVMTNVVVAGSLFLLPDPRYAAQLSYLVLLPLLWAAIRLQTAGVVVAVGLTTVIAVSATTLGRGPFAVTDLPASGRSVLLHLFLVGVGTTALLLASRTVESETHRGVATERAHLLAAVSHELRTPLTPIVGFSELLLARPQTLDETTRVGLEAIHRNGTHLTHLIDNLLLLHTSRHGHALAQPVVTDLVEAVHRHVDEHELLTGIELPPTDAVVQALVDPSHLDQILANLLDNAMRHGAPPVRVEVRDEHETVALSVVDHGPGVPAWFVPQQFDPFAQAVVGDRRPSIGLGLGLAISRDLAETNGGTLRYAPASEGEVRFTLRLPTAHGSPIAVPLATSVD